MPFAKNITTINNTSAGVLKKKTGLTALDYIQKIRIKRSCALLAGSNLTIREIAHQTGYDDIKLFNHVFHKMVGMTPSEYRKTSY